MYDTSPDGIPVLQAHTFDGMQNGQRVNFQDRAHARFYLVAEHRPYKSQQEGRPIFENVVMVEIVHPGEKDVLVRHATDDDKFRFNRQWALFQQNREQTVDGTPVSVLFPHHPDVVATLQYTNFKTVEQLANATDTQLQNIGLGAREWHMMAKNYLAVSEKGKDFHGMQAALEQRDREIATLKEMMARLQEQVNSRNADDDETPRRGPGRPRAA